MNEIEPGELTAQIVRLKPDLALLEGHHRTNVTKVRQGTQQLRRF